MNDFILIDEDRDLWTLLTQTRDLILKAEQKEMRRYGASATRRTTLGVILALVNKAIPAKISRRLFREPHSVSGLLSRMEDEGLVRKVKDLDRKNLVRVELTEKGYHTYYQPIREESLHRIMSTISTEQRQQLVSCLQTIREGALQELGIDRQIPAPVMSSAI